ncbi:MAG: ABC transporter ATP-binding protein [Saccharofermentans sp.]|nr:ABC transporter ATP-binding protein [Saccharofermentans sp.]
MVELINVHKSYTRDKETIKGVSFTVEDGIIYGLLGPNGAGKTTLMQMISTLLNPTSGEILIDGLKSSSDLLEIHRRIGYLTTEIKLDPVSTPEKLWFFFASLYDIDIKEAAQRKNIIFTKLGITPFEKKRIVELSTGMKQKVSIAISLIHNPPVIIFDEPTNGLDILTSKQVTDYLLELKKEGHSIILSTHIFSVSEALCDKIGVLVDGKIVAEGTVEELITITEAKSFEDAFFKLYVEHHVEE